MTHILQLEDAAEVRTDPEFECREHHIIQSLGLELCVDSRGDSCRMYARCEEIGHGHCHGHG